MLALIRVLKRSAVAVPLALAATVVFAPPAAANPNLTYEGRQISIVETMAAAHSAGFRSEEQLLAATSIAVAESSLYTRLRHWQPQFGTRPAGDQLGVQGPGWVNSSGAQLHADRGLWQISSRWWPQYSDAALDDPYQAARVLHEISRGAQDFSPWDTYRYGMAQAHYDSAHNGWPALRPAVRDFLANQGNDFSGDSRSTPASAGEVRHVLSSNGTLYKMAVQYYGDGDLWTRIAERNGVSVPEKLVAGQVLVVP